MVQEVPKELLETAGRILGEMVTRAGKDEEFRTLALADFAGAYKEHTGADLPEGVNMRFVEHGQGDPQAGLFELPSVTEELSDEDLKKVAGGFGPTVSMIVAVYGVFPPSLGGWVVGTPGTPTAAGW